MKIAIDTSCLLINPNSGLSEVVTNLISELPFVEKENEFVLFYNYFRSAKNFSGTDFPGTIKHTLKIPRRLINWTWINNWFYVDSLLPKADIYHSLHIQIPPSSRLKKVLTVHDCRFLAFPDFYPSQPKRTLSHLRSCSP